LETGLGFFMMIANGGSSWCMGMGFDKPELFVDAEQNFGSELLMALLVGI